MDEQDSPYDVLGVSHQASAQEIKSAYRKLALKHHPDKQRTDADREAAHSKFTAISHAYEILSDPGKRKKFDTEQSQQQNQPAASGGFSHDDFHNAAHRHHHQHPHNPFAGFAGFHDPFQVFESVFREEFGGQPGFGFGGGGQRRNSRDPFGDPFAGGDPFGSVFGGGQDPMMNMMRNSFFGPSMFGGFGNMGGGMGDPFGGNHTDRRRDSRNRNRDPFEQMFSGFADFPPNNNNNNNNNGQMYSSYSSTSTTSFGGRGGESVTTKTTTKLVNGVPQTVTEKIIHRADGTIERQVLQNGHAIEQGVEAPPAPRLEYNNDVVDLTADDHYDPKPQRQQQQQNHHSKRRNSKSNSKNQYDPKDSSSSAKKLRKHHSKTDRSDRT